MAFYNKRDTDTQEAVKELEETTGFKVIKARKNKGSMKEYITFKVDLNGVTTYSKLSSEHHSDKRHLIKHIEIKFLNRCLLNGNWNDTDETQAYIDVIKSSFKNVKWL